MVYVSSYWIVVWLYILPDRGDDRDPDLEGGL